MAEAKISVSEDQISCSICLDLLKDPVTIPCGHSYCMNCITDCWNKEDQRRVYSCPQCRQTFSPRPALNKNVMFTEMVEKLKKKDQMAQSLSYAEPGDVECDVCTARKRKAIHLHLHLVIWQTLLSKATYNWGVHKAIHLEEAIRQRKCS